MMTKQLYRVVLFAFAVLAIAGDSVATTFIVPDDAELVEKSEAIVTGVITAARAEEREKGFVETFYDVALDRVLKGPFQPRTRITINSPGGATETRFTLVHGAAHFRVGEEVLLFLTPHRGGWSPIAMTLGKFRFATTSKGYSVAVRDDEDIHGWDRDGKVHKEKVRLEAEFLHFIEQAVAGQKPTPNYQVDAGEVLPPALSTKDAGPAPDLFPAPATTYSVSFYTCALDRFPGRWETATMDAGVNFFKNSAQNASGLGDGGVSIIEDALAAWTDDCESDVHIQYGGTDDNLKDPDDEVNMVIFNDPGNHIAGSWLGFGTIATCFSSGGFTHEFDGTDFVSINDSDVIFQNGYAGTEATIQEAMTHEIGHGIGLRHADKHHLKTCTAPGCVITCNPETACDTNVEECASTAIMTAAVINGLEFTLQTWDQHGADRLYPGDCIVVEPPANVVATATSTSVVNVSWSAAVDADSYNVYRSTDGVNYTLAGNTAALFFNDTGRTADTAYLYKARSVNGGESLDSARDLATTTIFTDDPLVVGTTQVKAVHFTQLRTAIDAVRILAALGAGSYSEPLNAGVTPIRVLHLTELRTALDAARANLSLSTLSYGESITQNVTTIKGTHVAELRNGVK